MTGSCHHYYCVTSLPTPAAVVSLCTAYDEMPAASIISFHTFVFMFTSEYSLVVFGNCSAAVGFINVLWQITTLYSFVITEQSSTFCLHYYGFALLLFCSSNFEPSIWPELMIRFHDQWLKWHCVAGRAARSARGVENNSLTIPRLAGLRYSVVSSEICYRMNFSFSFS